MNIQNRLSRSILTIFFSQLTRRYKKSFEIPQFESQIYRGLRYGECCFLRIFYEGANVKKEKGNFVIQESQFFYILFILCMFAFPSKISVESKIVSDA